MSISWLNAARVVLPVSLFVLLSISPERSHGAPAGFSLRAKTGLDFSVGSYGASEDTRIFFVPMTVEVEWQRLLLGATASFAHSDGPGSVAGSGGDGVVVGAGSPARGTQLGAGDVQLRAGYLLWLPDPVTSLPQIEITGKLKLATADPERGLGTGETDCMLQLDVAKRFGRFTPFATAGYRWRGDPPGAELGDTPFASAGLSLSLTTRFDLGVSYDWQRSPVASTPDAHEIVPHATLHIGDRSKLTPYAVIGLSDGSPQFAAGLQLSIDVLQSGR